jgi:putative transposase
MSYDPLKGHAALRRGRVSQANASYFITLCTADRGTGLMQAAVASVLLHEMHAMQADETWRPRCGVIMPDHVHLLVRLGERLPLSRAVQRFKAKTAVVLRADGLAWERGFFDRRLRDETEVGAVFSYIYLNPYRAGLS